MRINIFEPIINSGKLKPTNDVITIHKGSYVEGTVSNALRSGDEKYYIRKYGLKHKRNKVYWFYRYSTSSEKTGIHVTFNWWQHQRFLLLQGDHWFQKEENIRYIVNIVFLIIGVLISLKVMG